MTDSDAKLREIFQRAHDPGWDRSRCPSAESLAQAAAGEASPDDRKSTAKHLMSCSACAGEFREAASLRMHVHAPTAPDNRSFSRVALAAAAVLILLVGAWSISLLRENRALSRELASSTSQRTQPVIRDDGEIRRLREESARQLEQIARLEQEAAEPPSPSINIPVIDLDPSAVLRGETTAAREISFPPAATSATLILNTRVEASHEGYALVMTDRDDVVMWESAGLIRSPYDTFTIALPKLAPGTYRLKLSGMRGGKRIALETYVISIRD